jgi:DNA replication regulator DPB11
VGLEWLKDSLQRHMILEEALYHPILSPDKVGAGAWNRKVRPAVQLGKHPCDEEAVPVVPRKLRRTASAKLGSQSETLWTEIVSGPPREELASKDGLRPPKSLPALKPVVMEPQSFATDSTSVDDDRRKLASRDSKVTERLQRGRGIFTGFGFVLHAFNSKQVRQGGQSYAARGFANNLHRRLSCVSTYTATMERFLNL